MATEPGCTYRFGPFELDTDSAELRHEGQPVKLAPQPFTVLRVLVARPGTLVTRDELRRAVWGDDHHVDFNAGLNFCLAQIRTALGESSTDPAYVVTVPRRGYRFVAPVTVEPGSHGLPGHARLHAAGDETSAPTTSAPTTSARRSPPRWVAAAALAALAVMVVAVMLWRPAVFAARPESRSLPAMTAFERGALDLLDVSPEELRSRVAFFEEAIRHDPTFARAFAGLAEAQLMLAEYRGDEPQRAYAMAKASAQRALDLKPDLPEAHAVLAAVLWQFNWDWTASERHLHQAMEAKASPTVLIWASRYKAAQGRTDDARRLAERAVELAPRSARAQTNLGTTALLGGDLATAVAACRRASALIPKFTPADMCLVSAAAELGQLPLAVERTRALTASPSPGGAAVPPEGTPASFDDLWRDRLSRLERHRDECQCDHDALSFAFVYARLGDTHKALDWLERAADLHVDGLVYAAVHPALRGLHGQGRFEVVLDRVGVVP